MSEDRNKLLQFEGWCGKPGDLWDKFDIRLMNGSTKTDDRGYSLAGWRGEGRVKLLGRVWEGTLTLQEMLAGSAALRR